MKSLKIYWVLIKHLWKSAVYKIMMPLMAVGFVYALFTNEDLTLGIPFIIFVLSGALFRIAYIDLGMHKK